MIRNQGKIEPNVDEPRRVKDLPRREYGAIRDKHVPLDPNDPIIAGVARAFTRSIEISNREISETSKANIMIEKSRDRNRPGVKCTGTISSIRANAQRDLPKSLIELGAKIKNSENKAQMPATSKQRVEAQMPDTKAQMPKDPPDRSRTKAQMPAANNTVPLPKDSRALPTLQPSGSSSAAVHFPINPLKPRFANIHKHRREITEKRITVLLGGPLVKMWGEHNDHFLKIKPPSRTPNTPPAEVKVLKFPEANHHPTPIQCSDYLDALLWSKDAKDALVQVVAGDFDLWSNMELRQQQQAIYKIAQLVNKKCGSQHRHVERKLCQVIFVSTPPPIRFFVPPSCAPNNFSLPHFAENNRHTNLQWVERVAHNLSSTHQKIQKYTRMPHFRDTARYADVSSVLPISGKNVLAPYSWTPPWPRHQGDATLDTLKTEARSAFLKMVTKVFYNYRPTEHRPHRRRP